jgi:hypothetical protein
MNDNGTTVTSFFPFGQGFTSGVVVAVGNLDGTNKDEIVVAPQGHNNNPVIKVFTREGTLLNTIPETNTGIYGYSLAVGDVTGDGTNEIVAASLGWVRVLKRDGTVIATTGLSSLPPTNALNYFNKINVALGDVTGDARKEIVLTGTVLYNSGTNHSMATYVQVSDLSGTLLRRWLNWIGPFWYSSDIPAELPVACGDVDLDGKDDIVVANDELTFDAMVWIYSFNYGKIGEFSPNASEVWSPAVLVPVTVATGDIDNDGKIEIVTSPSRPIFATNGMVRVFDP